MRRLSAQFPNLYRHLHRVARELKGLKRGSRTYRTCLAYLARFLISRNSTKAQRIFTTDFFFGAAARYTLSNMGSPRIRHTRATVREKCCKAAGGEPIAQETGEEEPISDDGETGTRGKGTGASEIETLQRDRFIFLSPPPPLPLSFNSFLFLPFFFFLSFFLSSNTSRGYT